MYQLLFFLEFASLFLLSKLLIKSLLRLFFRATKNDKITVWLLVFLFFPGTVVHEMAHFFSAGLLFVKTGSMELTPKITDGEIRLGSVEVAKTDLFRRAIIGVAPVLLGLIVIFGILYYLQAYSIKSLSIYIFSFYIIFTVGNTLFSSKKDLEGTVEFILALFLLMLILFVVKIEVAKVLFQILQRPEVVNFFRNADLFLVVPIVLDLTIVFLARFLSQARSNFG